MSNESTQGLGGNAAQTARVAAAGNKKSALFKEGDPISAERFNKLVQAVEALSGPIGAGLQVYRPKPARPEEQFRVTAYSGNGSTTVQLIPIDVNGDDVGTSPTDDITRDKGADYNLAENDIVAFTRVGNVYVMDIVGRGPTPPVATYGILPDDTIPNQDETIDPTDWDRINIGGSTPAAITKEGIVFTLLSRLYWDDTAGALKAFYREVTISRHGQILRINAEVMRTVFTATCTP